MARIIFLAFPRDLRYSGNMEQQDFPRKKAKRYTLRTFVQETFLTGNFFIQNDLITYASACAFSFLFSLLPVVIMCAVILIRVLKASPSVLNNLYQFDTGFSQILDVSHLVNSVLDFQGGIVFNIIVGVCQNAPYLLLDEPFSGIDVFTRQSFISLLKSEFLEENQTVIITTHEIDEVQDLADYVILLEDGKVFANFSKEEAKAEGLSIVEKMRTLYSEV